MAHHSRHSIFLHDNDKQKLSFIQSILDEEGLSFVLQEETVYQYDGEPLTIHLTVIFHYGAYTFIGYNIYEIYSQDNQSFEITATIAYSSRNYDHLPNRIKAQQILYDNLLERRKMGTLR